ncbi:MAG: terminase family protein [Anaerolineae bacterium]|nr:terminase family protein [Anaerolineae bacterium]
MTTHDQEQEQAPQIDTFKQFVQFNRPDFEFNWHHNVICDHLDRFVHGEIRRLMLMMPPRHSKTELISRQLPAYLFALNPDISIIACSHTAMLANFNNRDVRRYMEAAKYINRFPKTRLPTAKDRNYVRQQDLFEIADRRGYYRSAGVGGAITGMGFNVGIIDDPIKNRADANSETHREMIWDWYTSTSGFGEGGISAKALFSTGAFAERINTF